MVGSNLRKGSSAKSAYTETIWGEGRAFPTQVIKVYLLGDRSFKFRLFLYLVKAVLD